MTEIERKALALVNEVASQKVDTLSWCPPLAKKALCRAIERIEELEATEHDCRDCDYAKPLMELQAEFEAFKREVSDAVEAWRDAGLMREVSAAVAKLHSFILPKPDPLVEAIGEMALTDATPEDADRLRAALAARGLEIREARP